MFINFLDVLYGTFRVSYHSKPSPWFMPSLDVYNLSATNSEYALSDHEHFLAHAGLEDLPPLVGDDIPPNLLRMRRMLLFATCARLERYAYWVMRAEAY